MNTFMEYMYQDVLHKRITYWIIVCVASGMLIFIISLWANFTYLSISKETDRLQSVSSKQKGLPIKSQTGSPTIRMDAFNISADMYTDHSGDTSENKMQTEIPAPPVDIETQSYESLPHSGLWTINLVSFRNKADAECFLKEADSKGVASELQQVIVNGKEYWRVQVPGFFSSGEAREKASQIQKKLELKHVWIFERKST